MNDEELKALFGELDTTPGDRAKAAAMNAALRAFDEQVAADTKFAPEQKTAQGNARPLRPTPESPSLGSKIMNVLTVNSPVQRWVYSGMASAAVLVAGVFIALQVPWDSGIEQSYPPPAGPTRQAGLEEVVVTARRPAEGKMAEMEMDMAAVSAAAAPADPGTLADAELATQGYAAADESLDMRASGAAAAAPEARVFARVGALPAPHPGELPAAQSHYQDSGRDQFASIEESPVKRVSEAPVSTFSIDVDTAAYSFIRRQLNHGVLPQKNAVRIEEMVNYFPYDYPLPASREQPFSTSVTLLDAPWKAGNKLLHIGIQGYELQAVQPRSNLVFLLDVSGSMNAPDKLPLVKQSMGLLLSQLQPEDTVAIVVYAGAAGTVLEPTAVKDKQKILGALDRLQAGGSTAGGAGIQLAYQLAQSQFIEGGVNRILLATDGDFNVGIRSGAELQDFVERKRESGVYLSVLGFGQGNYNDALMQVLAQNGNGIAAYIDTLGEAQKVLVDEATSALFPIATDVKIQLEFNPATVSEYRLIGYETRALAQEDFNNDAVDAGDIGAGHSVTAIYEITPAGSDSGVYEPSRYHAPLAADTAGSEYGYLKLRYKLPGQSESKLIEQPVQVAAQASDSMLQEARFAAAVAGFGELLRGGKYSGDWTYEDARELAQANRGDDPYGYRSEFVQLIRKAETASAM